MSHSYAKRSRVARPTAEAGHTHLDERGFVVKCYHKSKGLLTNWQFWLGVTLTFPLEHYLWEKAWPFYLITERLGL
jgi:hypothetical protein